MFFLKVFFLSFYFVVLGLLAVYGAHRWYLVWLYYKTRNNRPVPKKKFSQLPFLTIQLPIYNELYVVERLLEAVAGIEYPQGLFEIQVLDDSVDETAEVARKKVDELKARGFDAVYLHRKDRTGFKAGALDVGLRKAKGEFLMIFDADFIPSHDVARKTIQYFTDPEIGMVQFRWGHVNRDYSLLTQIQSIFLDGHFVIEHTARNRGGCFFNFNGTAGVWRKTAIIQSGGWQHDTLTEDLDLSYRAQLAGWKFVYLPEVTSPAELPVEMNSFKSQQHRWAKGSIQTGLKLLPRIWQCKLPFPVKLEATFHLTNNLSYILMIIMALLLYPALLLRLGGGWRRLLIIDLPLFLMATLSVSSFYVCSQKEIYKKWFSRIRYLPLVTSVGIGLSVNNAKAVLEALFGYSTPFQRTPKFGVINNVDSWSNKKYRAVKNFSMFFELFLAIYFTFLIGFVFVNRIYFLIPFLLMFQVGFFYVFFLSAFQKPGVPKEAVTSCG
ncbi:MAG: glycosyltransferase family 2 protein [Candidatus Theseobacter exili]|nr:glycosyltransferase family 2 protein [Candidatus Theseobacter exili]